MSSSLKSQFDEKRCGSLTHFPVLLQSSFGTALRVTCKELGGVCYDDTLVAANRWCRARCQEIDQQKVNEPYRPNEAEYLDELASIQNAINSIKPLLKFDKTLQATIDKLYRKRDKISKLLKAKKLPPLPKDVKNPLDISKESVEEEAEEEAYNELLEKLKMEYEIYSHDTTWLTSHGYIDLAPHQFLERLEEILDPELDLGVNFDSKTNIEKIQEVQRVVHKINHEIMERKAGETLGIMYFKTKEVEERYDVVDDFTRGRVTQQIKDLGDGFDPQESRLVVDHVEKYIAYHEKRLEDNIIKAGHMDQIRIRISYYKMWVQESGIVAVKKIGDKSHIDAYFDYLRNKQKEGAFGDRYRKYLFAGFKAFLLWLKQEGILPDFNPPWTNLRNDPYKIKVKKTKPKLISITNFRKIYDKAPPRLQLFMCLIANCGCGEGEIGRLEKSEYRPKSGRIVHTRVKTEDMEDTPEVNYLLWDRTKELLEQQLKAQKKYKRKQNDRDYLLVNHNGNPLWWERYEATEKNPVKHHIRSDSIRQEFDEFIKKIQKEDKELAKIEIKFYMIRRKIASMIYSNPTFRPLDWIWLGHAPPKTTSKQYYVDPNPKILDDCLKWIEQKLFVDPIDPEEDDHDFYFE